MESFFRGVKILFLVLVLNACDLGDDGVSYHFVSLPVVDVGMPESFRLNETYEIGVTLLLPNGCAQFEGFDVTSEDTTVRRVVAIGTEVDGPSCTQEVSEVEATFRFICLYPETYRFLFWTGEDESGEPRFLEIEVPVTR
ncbi:hypothetical protein [Robiginitalea marina]|jgi:hypothetical protein|uniref:Proteinase inhibitor I42 chagasin domain-containing protein n=1 Tax=Robiginitalea marina TaxID=2954105 RepID=A0ABT1AX57_9FLAO|nr:hypothetical protein [Robiginitalea marina]MCO5724274.1 hypothetical protein [Robiginitalea marina]